MTFDEYHWPIMAGHTPFSHQKETTKFVLMNPRSYILNDMGTGKTLSAIWGADLLMRMGKIDKVLIVCPLSTMQTAWGRDISFNIPERTYILVHGSKDYRTRALATRADFYIINHDGVKIMENEIKKAKFSLVIIDELTAFKNFMAERTKAMFRVAYTCKGVWGMTGEPTPNSPVEAYGQCKVVNPFNPFLPPYFTQYKNMVLDVINEYVSVPKEGAQHTVNRIMQPAIRFTRQQCIDLPPCLKTIREIPLTPEQHKAYMEMKKELLVEHQNGIITAANAAVKLVKLLQIAAGVVKDTEGEEILYPCANRLTELYDIYQSTPQHKLVIFSAYRASVRMIHDFFARQENVRVGMIYGGTDQKLRSQYISEFQGGQLNVLVIQPAAASHGITLTAANTVVWHSLVSSNETYNQANHRIIRIGQIRGQFIIHLVGCAAEKHLLRLLDSKHEFSETVMNTFEEIINDSDTP